MPEITRERAHALRAIARLQRIRQQLRATRMSEKKSLTSILKGDDGRRYMFIITSNAYIDREQEILKHDALKALVDAKWDGDTFIGDDVLLFWHKGDPIGDIVYADMVGRFLVEVARERADAPIRLGSGKKARIAQVWDFIEHTGKALEWGASHGFKYYPRDREHGVYNRIVRKWETSVLPVQYAANSYTYAGVKHGNAK